MNEFEVDRIIALLQKGEFEGARKYLGTLSGEEDFHYWYYLGVASRKINDLETAAESIDKAILLDDKSSPAYFELGLIHQARKEYGKAIDCLTKSLELMSDGVTPIQRIDSLNSLALTYKRAGDIDNALKYYNLSLETLAQDIHDWIKTRQIHELPQRPTLHPTTKTWYELALAIATKSAAKDGIENIRVPTGETALKLIQQNPIIGRAFYDDGKTRYILPAYFDAFFEALKGDILYSTIVSNVGTLLAETAEIRRAGECFMEAIDFIPQGSGYTDSIVSFNRLREEYGANYWE